MINENNSHHINNSLSQDQIAEILGLIKKLSPSQMQWLSGYLTGQNAAINNFLNVLQPQVTNDRDEGANDVSQNNKLTILFGTKSGNSQYVAEIAEAIAKTKGIDAKSIDMLDYKPKNIRKETNLLIVVSTDGEGEPPFGAKELYDFLSGSKAPKLKGLNYSVLALGDKTYQYFCKTGIDFDEFLSKLGANKVYERAELDLDFEDDARKWLNNAINYFADNKQVDEQTSQVNESVKSVYNKKNPFNAPLIEKIKLNGRGSEKETFHIELSIENSGLEYEPGDAVGIFPKNSEPFVDKIIETLGLNPDIIIITEQETLSLRNALINKLEITVVNPEVLKKYNKLAYNPEIESILDDNDKLKNFLWGTDVLDLLIKYPVKTSAQAFVDVLHTMPPRLYSISSSLKANPDEVHLTIGAVRYTKDSRDRHGVGSTFFADALEVSDTIPIYIDKNRVFKLPENPDAPVIMVGPGTGVAPFRAFLQEREELEAEGYNWLFFGDQHFTTDFLYQTEFQKYLKSGVLTNLDVAFSRDQEEKIYVQHKMEEKGEELYQWLQSGAFFYVCGDKNKMAKDVHNSLLAIIQKHGNKTIEESQEYLTNLMKQRRYLEDVY